MPPYDDDLTPEIEAKVADLTLALKDPAYSHAENILVALRKHELLGTPYPAMVEALHDEFIVSTNTP